jgi:hypothetical protein
MRRTPQKFAKKMQVGKRRRFSSGTNIEPMSLMAARNSPFPPHAVCLVLSRDEGVAVTFCDGASQLHLAATASFRFSRVNHRLFP